MRRIFVPVVSFCLLILSACGGGGGAGPQPTPPPPAPPASPSYSSFDNLVTTQFDTASTRLDWDDRFDRPATITDHALLEFSRTGGSNNLLSYDASTKTYTFKGSKFGPAELNGPYCHEPAGFDCYSRDTGNLYETFRIYQKNESDLALTYTTFVFARSAIKGPSPNTPGQVRYAHSFNYAVTGFKTQPTDMPKSGSVTFPFNRVEWLHVAPDRPDFTFYPGKADFTADFGAGTVSTRLTLEIPTSTVPNIFGIFNGSGSIATGTPVFSGSIGDSKYNGSFEGAFFGPRASEMGYTFMLTEGAGNDRVIGAVIGKSGR